MQIQIYINKNIRNNTKYNELYTHWYRVWKQAYTEDFNIDSKISSDYFSTQDIFITLEEKDSICGLITLKYFDLSSKCDLDNSYFDHWPAEQILQLQNVGRHYFSCGNLSIDKEYRSKKYQETHPLKDILFAAVREILMMTKCDGVISSTRNKKSVNLSAYRTGALPLLQNVEFKISGQPVDLLLWHREYLKEYDNQSLEVFIQNQMNSQGEFNEYQNI